MNSPKWHVGFLLINVVGILLLTSCGSFQLGVPVESPPTFLLSGVQLTPDDFPGHWEWIYLDSGQEFLTPSPENNFSTEYTSAYLVGHYYLENQKFTFTIYHDVRDYVKSTPFIDSPFTDGSFGEAFSIQFIEVKGNLDSKCSRQPSTKSNPIFLCEILVKYEHIQSFLRITGDINTGQQIIESLINQLLTVVDRRIGLLQ